MTICQPEQTLQVVNGIANLLFTLFTLLGCMSKCCAAITQLLGSSLPRNAFTAQSYCHLLTLWEEVPFLESLTFQVPCQLEQQVICCPSVLLYCPLKCRKPIFQMAFWVCTSEGINWRCLPTANLRMPARHPLIFSTVS